MFVREIMKLAILSFCSAGRSKYWGGARWNSGSILAMQLEGSRLESDPCRCVVNLGKLFTPHLLYKYDSSLCELLNPSASVIPVTKML